MDHELYLERRLHRTAAALLEHQLNIRIQTNAAAEEERTRPLATLTLKPRRQAPDDLDIPAQFRRS